MVGRSLIANLALSVLVASAASAAGPMPLGPERIVTIDDALGVIAYSGWRGACGMGGFAQDSLATPSELAFRCGNKKSFVVRYRDTPVPKSEDRVLLDAVLVRDSVGKEVAIRVHEAHVPHFLRAWSILAGLTPERAADRPGRRELEAARGRVSKAFLLVPCNPDGGVAMRQNQLILFRPAGFQLICTTEHGGSGRVIDFRFRDNPTPPLEPTLLDGAFVELKDADGVATRFQLNGKKENAPFVGDWSLLAAASTTAAVEAESAFEAAVASYRAAPQPPELPEAARRFKVQAELAVRERRYRDAVQRFAEALEVAPWWPNGRYNRALILAELGRFEEAIEEMQRYLRLVPEAPNARQAQDRIYEWEVRQRG